MTGRSALLLPDPERLRLGDGTVPRGELCFAPDQPPAALIRPAVDYLVDRCRAQRDPGGGSEAPRFEVRFVLAEHVPPEGYELEVTTDGVEIRASGRRGLFYGAGTLRQWLSIAATDAEEKLAEVEVHDQPDFPRRGFLLDISRNKVPTLASLLRLVDLLADLKLNELQLYMENTFAYPGHEEVWRDAGALSADDVRRLDTYCRMRCIELVPNQNSFGHFHRWLSHPSYRHLAECPEGIQHPFSEAVEPFSLCPIDPRSLELLRDLYAKLLPHFTSGRFHVGFDETFEIGRGRSKAACAEVGLDGVYLAHLEAVRRLAAEHNRRIQIWADMVLEHRGLLPRIPDDVTLCAWGYEAGHPFREDTALLGSTGCELYVCPGTSSWSSFAGRLDNARANLQEAAGAGLATGARGYLVTDWGDRGHLQPFSASYLGLVVGAAQAWNGRGAERRAQTDWADAIDRWVLDAPGSGIGAAALDLAGAHRLTGATQQNGTALFHLVMSPDDGLEHRRYRGLAHQGLTETRHATEAAIDRIAQPSELLGEAARASEEVRWIADTLALACDIGVARLDSPFSELPALPAAVRERLRATLTELAERRAELWLERNRPQGLESSLHLLTKLGRRLES